MKFSRFVVFCFLLTALACSGSGKSEGTASDSTVAGADSGNVADSLSRQELPGMPIAGRSFEMSLFTPLNAAAVRPDWLVHDVQRFRHVVNNAYVYGRLAALYV